jgi:hypothetical protein
VATVPAAADKLTVAGTARDFNPVPF